jgi:hypothetical protein
MYGNQMDTKKKERSQIIHIYRGHDLTEDLKDSTKILLDLIITFDKAARYKLNIQKSVSLLYTKK